MSKIGVLSRCAAKITIAAGVELAAVSLAEQAVQTSSGLTCTAELEVLSLHMQQVGIAIDGSDPALSSTSGAFSLAVLDEDEEEDEDEDLDDDDLDEDEDEDDVDGDDLDEDEDEEEEEPAYDEDLDDDEEDEEDEDDE